MGRGWAVEWLSLFIPLSKSTALGGSVTLGLAAGTGTSSKCLSETLPLLLHTERQELKGSVAVPVCCHSRAKHHCRLSVLQCSLPALSMSRNIRSSILDCFQNKSSVTLIFLYLQKSFFHHRKSKINQSFVSWLQVPRADCVFTSIC